MPENSNQLKTALYIRLSREDGDKSESLSISNQRLQLMEFVSRETDLYLYDTYIDDGYTGTNFNRPAFERMIKDIESRNVQCVVVKDLSRLGRNMPEVSRYINEYFPVKKVRFIAINDSVDRKYYDIDASEDMMIDVKNMFNGFYPKDISKKVRSTFRTKQSNGQFIGAFASFGYVKSAKDHNKLEVDEYAADIVRRIFAMYVKGIGQNTIAKILNEENIPCPSEYKKQQGLNYHNSNRLDATSYWTYSTIRNILKNEIYIGNMVQNKSFRQMCKKSAVSLPKEKWIVVENTHEPIIDRDTWDKVQDLLKRNTRHTSLTENVHMFAGYLKCGDCGRAMVKIRRKGVCFFNCGSYNRYGKKFCSIHSITEQELEGIVLDDLNLIISSVKDISRLIEEENQKQRKNHADFLGDISKYQAEIDRLVMKKERAYDDYSDGLITRDDYMRYRDKYEQQISAARSAIEKINQLKSQVPAKNPWIEKLLQYEKLYRLDRDIVVEMISMIYIYENNTIKIVYNFSNELEALLNRHACSD
ncbi:MAG: recombinase family protein [Lachnospiraceae bacterium]|nr:recombinase family protein [Lachnospiraceae bacterium]